jgi:site-specific recombinase XerD
VTPDAIEKGVPGSPPLFVSLAFAQWHPQKSNTDASLHGLSIVNGNVVWVSKRDRALLALLLACGLRRHEAVSVRLDHLQQREEHWAIVDLVGKGGHVRTVPMPDWVRSELNDWLLAAAIDRGKLFRRVNKVGRAWGEGITEKSVWHIVKESAKDRWDRPISAA